MGNLRKLFFGVQLMVFFRFEVWLVSWRSFFLFFLTINGSRLVGFRSFSVPDELTRMPAVEVEVDDWHAALVARTWGKSLAHPDLLAAAVEPDHL